MHRIVRFAWFVGLCFASASWAQPPATTPLLGNHLAHQTPTHIANNAGKMVSRSFTTPANPNDIWELGTYPGGTWFATWHINDLGVIVGLGDMSPTGRDGFGYTHTLAIPLFGPNAGQWIDIGTLRSRQPKAWQEPLNDISNTGLIASHSTAPGGQSHAVVWTRQSGLLDLGTLADTGDPAYRGHNSSAAYGTNKLGTLIVGASGINGDAEGGFQVPVAWTPSRIWTSAGLVTKWNIQKLDTTAFPDLAMCIVWKVNDYGQIIGTGSNADGSKGLPLLWNLRADGKGWNLVILPQSSVYPFSQTYDINEKGEIIGVVASSDFSTILPVLWKPLDKERTTYSEPILPPLPKGGFASCWGVGINDPGDMVGDCWDEAYTKDLPTRWSTKDLTYSELINFPADWGFAWGVNNNRIATITYTGGTKCSSGIPWTTTCGGAVQLH